MVMMVVIVAMKLLVLQSCDYVISWYIVVFVMLCAF